MWIHKVDERFIFVYFSIGCPDRFGPEIQEESDEIELCCLQNFHSTAIQSEDVNESTSNGLVPEYIGPLLG